MITRNSTANIITLSDLELCDILSSLDDRIKLQRSYDDKLPFMQLRDKLCNILSESDTLWTEGYKVQLVVTPNSQMMVGSKIDFCDRHLIP